MRRMFSFAVLAVALAAPASAQVRPTALSPAAIAQRATPATVTIVVFDAAGDTLGQGSGVIIRPSGEILTNYHVMAGASRALVRLASGERFDRVLAVDGDSTADIAIIKVPGFGLPVVPLSGTIPPVGSRVVVIGSPLGLSQTVSDGIISALRVRDGKQRIQISAPISHGSSGGPVFSETGDVIGIATAFIEGGQQLNFAMPVKYALGLLAEKREPTSLASMFASSGAVAAGEVRATTPSASEPSAAVSAARDVVVRFLKRPDPPRATRATLPFAGTFVVTDTIAVITAKPKNVEPYLVVHTGTAYLLESGWGLRTTRRRLENDTLSDATYERYLGDVNAVADGRLSMRAISIVEASTSGYQVENGAFFTSVVEGDSVSTASRMWLKRYSAPLNENGGLYDVTLRTQWRQGSQPASSTYLDWTGEFLVAAVDSGDSVYVTVGLHNTSGGSSAMQAVAGRANKDGLFVAISRDKSTELRFSVRNGRVTGDWIDRRENGAYFFGTLTGGRK